MFEKQLIKNFDMYVEKILAYHNQENGKPIPDEFGLNIYGYEDTIFNFLIDNNYSFSFNKDYKLGDVVVYKKDIYIVLDDINGINPIDSSKFKKISLHYDREPGVNIVAWGIISDGVLIDSYNIASVGSKYQERLQIWIDNDIIDNPNYSIFCEEQGIYFTSKTSSQFIAHTGLDYNLNFYIQEN